MKNITRNAEQVTVAVVILGLILRLLEIELADTILMIGLLTLSFVYLMFGMLAINNNLQYLTIAQTGDTLTTVAKMISGLCGLAMSIAAIGIMFRILHWPSWQFMLMTGVVACAVCLLLCYLVVRPQHEKLASFLNYRMVMMLGMSLLLMYSSL